MRKPQRAKKASPGGTPSFHLSRKHIALILLVAVAGAIGFATFGHSKSPGNSVAALQSGKDQATSPAQVSMVVAVKQLQTGDPFDLDSVSTVSQPADRVPADAIKSLHELEGRVALGPISAMSPVTRSTVGNPVAVMPASVTQGDGSVVENLLAALGTRMRRVTVTLSGEAPLRGSRVALVYNAPSGKQSLTVKQAWVVTGDAHKVVLLMAPEDASVLKTFPPDATFGATLLRDTESARDVVQAAPIQSAAEAG